MPIQRPSELTLRTYNVGFGDCFLLTFHYPRNSLDKHVLIDFGSTRLARGMPTNQLERIAENIRTVTDGKLHAIVVTHRHLDHLSGFASNRAGSASGDIIAGLKPDVVIQPWTEDPRTAPNAQDAPDAWSDRQAFAATLSSMQDFAKTLTHDTECMKRVVGVTRLKELGYLGQNNIQNRSAVENLVTMGKRHVYVHYGSKSGLERVLPGVTTHVLGPPTLKQSKGIRRKRSRDEAEYWHVRDQYWNFQAEYWRFQAAALETFVRNARTPFSDVHIAKRTSPHTRWLVPRLDHIRGDQLLQIARNLDRVMNNTSVILLFEIGGKKLLFPGDAQIENWMYALTDAPDADKNLQLLADVDLYKVGHHGSLIATPKTLWQAFQKKSRKKSQPDRLVSILSTMRGVHGSPSAKTEVPRKTLEDELKLESNLVSTLDLSGGKLCVTRKITL